MKKVLLIGNPNVGKSAVFSRLTGVDAISSNYPGTSVEFVKGYMRVGDENAEVIDVPGTFSLEPSCKAEEVASEMLSNGGDIIINVVDSTNLERNLNLTLQLLKQNTPIVTALNFWDETKHLGISIDVAELERMLGVPVVAICGRTGEGVKKLVDRLGEAKSRALNFDNNEKWKQIGEIVSRVQKLSHRHHTFLDRLSEISIQPLTGIPFALFILFLTFKTVRFLGETLILGIDYLFNTYYFPFITNTVIGIFHGKFLQDLLLGTTPKVMESFGLLTTGIYIPLVVVLPYVFAFYFALSILEDIGYLPRVAVLLDSTFHKIGVHGYTAIPVILGLGCKVPGILATRILETEREKIIATVLILMAAPCMPQTAMIISLIGPYGVKYLFLIYFVLFFIAVINGFILNKILKGETPELFVEIPPYRVPYVPSLIKKMSFRVKSFLLEAVPLIIVGVFIVGLLDALGVTNFIVKYFGGFVVSVLGLPPETISVIMLGFLRKDISIALLSPLGLTVKQLVVASVFLAMYLPCIATLFTLLKELGLRRTLKIVTLVFFISILVAASLNLIL